MTASNRVLVALSGGVDSSVCVRLLQQQGYDVSAVVMQMSELHSETVEAARQAASTLGVPLTILDLRQEFEETVIRYFLEEYKKGRTPNPCIVCNPKIKFRHLFLEADRQGCRYAATGHYARVEIRNGKSCLLRGTSPERDQSYMLYRLTQRELTRLLLPLAELEKPVVRKLALQYGLSCADKPDSQENCFIDGKDYTAYIRLRMSGLPEGDFIAPDGTVCGRHKGIAYYTVGQRKGLGIALGRPVFVREIDPESNRIYLADAGAGCFSAAVLSEVTFPSGEIPAEPFSADVKIRSAAKPIPASLFPLDNGGLRVKFASPQRAVAKGQSIVFYAGNMVLGGGFIESVEYQA